jgi:hypothetical protein
MAIETLRPTANTLSGLGSYSPWANPANAYDGNSGTAATASEFVNTTATIDATMTLETWQAAAHQSGYTALVLKVTYSVVVSLTATGSGTSSASWTLTYSTDGGSTFTTLASGFGSQASTTVSVSLSTSQNLADLQFSIVAQAAALPKTGTASSTCDASVVDVWTEGTYVPGLAGCFGYTFGF